MVTIARSLPRPISFTPNINPYAEGSVIVEFGNTKVHVTAMVEEDVPPFLRGKGQGWVTAEYSMLPASGGKRIVRDRKSINGRSQEIQRELEEIEEKRLELDKRHATARQHLSKKL